MVCKFNILREKSLAIYLRGSQFRRNGIFNFIMSKIYVDERSRVRLHLEVDVSHNVKSNDISHNVKSNFKFHCSYMSSI